MNLILDMVSIEKAKIKCSYKVFTPPEALAPPLVVYTIFFVHEHGSFTLNLPEPFLVAMLSKIQEVKTNLVVAGEKN